MSAMSRMDPVERSTSLSSVPIADRNQIVADERVAIGADGKPLASWEWVVVIGEQEVAEGTVLLKDFIRGSQVTLPLREIAESLAKRRESNRRD